jgi:hypothetical protein
MPSREKAQGKARRKAKAKEEEREAPLEEQVDATDGGRQQQHESQLALGGLVMQRLLIGGVSRRRSFGPIKSCTHGYWFGSSEWKICEDLNTKKLRMIAL